MPRESAAAKELATLINTLQAERQEHVDAIAQIDATFEQFGIIPSAKKRLGRPRKTVITAGPALPEAAAAPAKKGTRKARRHFPVSGLDSVLAFVSKAGKKGATGAEIIKHWKSDGRSGNGYKTLGELVKAKKLKREKIEGAQGSRYTVI
jgi:hypothetical protein